MKKKELWTIYVKEQELSLIMFQILLKLKVFDYLI